MTRVYISGPMTGKEDHNFPQFNAAAERLAAMGYDEVENPAEKGVVPGWGWTDYLRYDLARVVLCDAIYMLPGWQGSPGARLERYVADQLGLRVLGDPRPATPDDPFVRDAEDDVYRRGADGRYTRWLGHPTEHVDGWGITGLYSWTVLTACFGPIQPATDPEAR